ncbi:16126_t:CDS:2, partial [Gigaspora margarita]
MLETIQTETDEDTDDSDLEKESVLEPEIKPIKFVLTDELALKGYGSQPSSYLYADQGLTTTGSEFSKYEKNDLIDTDMKGFTTISYKKAMIIKKE